MTEYQVIIGLEVHVQLQTQTKIFCGCGTQFLPDQPNVQTCPVCLGLPGSLPVLNRQAFHLAVKTALALNCQIAGFTKWDRKQYFYPDLPKGYQISQYDLPFSSDGFVDLAGEQPGDESRRIRILRAHLEEDAGKNLHDESGRGNDSQVDLNRAGTPLVEIVTQPDLRSAADARRFLEELRLMLLYLGVSDCNMQEGSLRCDANVNLHLTGPAGEKIATPIVEIKNLNSFRFAEQAITYEANRQWEEYRRTGQKLGDVPKQTRGYDPERGVTTPQRSKEEAADYRYFPDPDLVPVTVTPAEIEAIRAEMCELPAVRRQRFHTEWGLSTYDANVVLDQGREFADYFVELAGRSGDGKQAANWLTQDVLRELKSRKQTITEFPLTAEVLGDLLGRVTRRQLTTKSAREVFSALLEAYDADEDQPALPTVAAVEELITSRGLALVEESGAVEAAIAEVLSKNAKAVADFKAGKQAAIGALIGQVMRQLKGADPQAVREKLIQTLGQG